jgi:cob(I)alamin adenosyltransferase
MSISTKTGDDGTSALLFNRRVPKTDLRIEAYGTVDELNAALGLARASIGPGDLNNQIVEIQKELVLLMGELALLDEDRPKYETRGHRCIDSADVDRLTAAVHNLEKTITFADWATPGANPTSAAFDFARTVCRRAERRVLTLNGGDLKNAASINPEIIRYLNRLSDLCWIWARQADQPASPH